MESTGARQYQTMQAGRHPTLIKQGTSLFPSEEPSGILRSRSVAAGEPCDVDAISSPL